MEWQRGLLFAWAVLSLMPCTAIATENDAQQLYDWCKQPAGSPLQMYCLGFVGGVGGAMVAAGSICGNPTIGARVQAFINWAEKNPRRWGLPDTLAVIWALKETWPCSAK
jgi:hypothetical protein